MKRFVSGIVLAAAVVSAPAFASGYGPAPYYSAAQGAPASQRGQSAQTLAAEHYTQDVTHKTTITTDSTDSKETALSAASN